MGRKEAVRAYSLSPETQFPGPHSNSEEPLALHALGGTFRTQACRLDMCADWRKQGDSGSLPRTLAQGDMEDEGDSEWSVPKMTKPCGKAMGAKAEW